MTPNHEEGHMSSEEERNGHTFSFLVEPDGERTQGRTLHGLFIGFQNLLDLAREPLSPEWLNPEYATQLAIFNAERIVANFIPQWRREAERLESDGELDPVDARLGWDLLAHDLRHWRADLASALRASDSEPQWLLRGWIVVAQLDALASTWEPLAIPPVVLYLDDEDQYPQVREALDGALDAFGLTVTSASPKIVGSIRQVLIAALKRQATEERVDSAVGMGRAGLEARWFAEPQSKITLAQGEAIAKLIDSLKDTENALLSFSNILILKVDKKLIVRELMPEQVVYLQQHPHLFDDPREALAELQLEPAPAALMARPASSAAFAPSDQEGLQ
jgi:hypothetical protein